MRKNTLAWLTCVSALPAICAAITLSSGPPELMRRATRVAAIPSRYNLRAYHWIKPGELLVALDDLNPAGEETAYKVAHLHTDTGVFTFLQRNNLATKNAFEYAFSPDGRWYLCLASAEGRFTYDLCSTDDSGCRRVYSEHSDGVPSYPFAWLGDSQHWLNTGSFLDTAEIRTLATPGRRSLSRPSQADAYPLILSTDRKHTALQSYFGEEPVNTVAVAFWDIDTPASSRKIQVRLPVRAHIMEATVSPSGERIAWLLHVREGSRFYALLSRYLHFLPRPKPNDTYQVWTTALDGSRPSLAGVKQIHVVWGQATSCFPAGWQHEGGVYDLGWTADSKKVSFRQEDTLYTVPVEP